jgi:predicted ATPase
MRQYVPQRDVALRRSAENLSATVGWLERAEDPRFRRLVELVQDLSDHEIRDVSLIRSELGDVMLTLEEGLQGRTPAREMSDGMLRFMAISTALLTGGRSLDADAGDDTEQPVTLVIEELENGVHPSQASALLNLVRQASREPETQIAVTTHSPALLNALDAADHAGVMVCSRDRATGTSRITPLTALDGYAVAMASGELGDVVTKGGIPAAPSRDRDFSEFDRLLGIG